LPNAFPSDASCERIPLTRSGLGTAFGLIEHLW